MEDPELKYGLSVTGIVHPASLLTNANAKPGDFLVLTKPLGTGVLATALKGKKLDEKILIEITELMATLNKDAAEVMTEVGVNACTDITGFGLLGHALEMARASKVGLRVYAEKVPVIPDAKKFAAMGIVPAGSFANQKFCSHALNTASSIDPILLDLMSDTQTSGGLLIAVSKQKAPLLVEKLRERKTPSADIIGEVLNEPVGVIQVL